MTVQIAYLHGQTVSHCWYESMVSLNKEHVADGAIAVRGGTGMFAVARNTAVRAWLDGPHEWLWFIDTDMGFKPDTVDRLLEAADPGERPVVGGLCFQAVEWEPDGYGGWRVLPVPTLYDWTGDVFQPRFDFEPDQLVQVAGTGAGCLLIHRSAAEKVTAEHGEHWFDHVHYDDGTLVSEDLSFCWRLGTIGVPVFVDTGVRTTHHKQTWIGPDNYRQPEVS